MPNCARTLVLLPGMDGSGLLFRPLCAALGADLATQVIALPQHGPQDYPALLECVRLQLPAAGEIDLLGESFSGPLAVLLAATFPARIRSLILCCSFVRAPRPRWMRLLALATRVPPRLVPLAPVLPLLLGAAPPAGLDRALRTALAPLSARVLRARLRAVAEVDVRVTLRAVPVPVLLLWAQHDRLLPKSTLDDLLRQRPAARLAVLPGPHALLQTQPAAAAAVIRGFVEELGAAT